ncbi:MAG TPA: sulfotransferase [Candidatus Saccharimonadales bacterium]|nr:sulfotransferase [Candidatus Saccharimonadales bacterium]
MAISDKKPNFLIIGAPRCGTTSLHDKLSRHPEIFMSNIKEPHFFSSFDFPFPENEIHHVTHNPDVYGRLFEDAGNRLAGESSTYYLADPEAPAKIKAYNPDMKLIAILRDPVDRAYSQYLQYERRGKQTKTFAETIELLLAEPGESPIYDLVMLGRYGEQLQRYYQHFPKKQLLVVMFDDLTKQPVETLAKILNFLGVDPSPAGRLAEAAAQNQHQVPRSQTLARLANNRQIMKVGLKLVPRPLLRFVRNNILLKKGSDKAPLDEETALKLQDAYAADEKVLAKVLGRPASWIKS